MSFKHVQPQQHIHGLFLQHRKTSGEVIVLDLNLHHVYPPNNFLYSHPFGNSRPSRVHQSHDITPFRTRHRHNRSLRPGVDEGFHGEAVHVAVDVEHHNGAKCFWIVLHGRFHVSFYVFLANFLCDQSLRFCVERICVHHANSLFFSLGTSGYLLAKH